MPLLIVLGILIIWGIVAIAENCGGKKTPFTSEEIHSMTGDMIGKSQKECQEILKSYTRAHKENDARRMAELKSQRDLSEKTHIIKPNQK